MTTTTRRTFGAVRGRLGDVVRAVRHSPGGGAPDPDLVEDPLTGMVEQFSRRMAAGWVSVPPETEPTKVTLHLNRLQVAATYASPDASMSGFNSVLRREDPEADQPQVLPGELLVHRWQAPNIAGPADDRRNSAQEVRTFSFRLRGIWPYVNRRTRITVRVDGRPLPIYGHGTYLCPPRNGKQTLDDLRAKLAQGYLLAQTGKLQLSKKLDEAWQRTVMEAYQHVRRIVAEEYGYDVFFIYGTLLGAVREGGHIGHDVDMDAAFVSRHTSGRAAAGELQQIALTLIARGLDVRCMRTALHIRDPRDPSAKIDLFHTYFDDEGRLSFPFGVAGTTVVTRDDWRGTREIDFPGGTGLVPVNAEQVVEHLYGIDWRRPKPGFNWNLDRTGSARTGRVSARRREKVYWANFYAHMEYTEGSTFFEFVNSRPDIPGSVLDIGCGDGRDSCAFGAAGRQVVGLDLSPVGIEHARTHATRSQVVDRVSFEVCDVGDRAALEALLLSRTTATDAPVMFYLRFFLHSIPEGVQERLMGAISSHARPGDVLAAEFRTDKDAAGAKVHGKHYRRFQSASEFSRRLRDDYGFTVEHEEEGTGLSPYQGEDPVLYRVIARRLRHDDPTSAV